VKNVDSVELVGPAERIARTVHEHRGRAQRDQMLGASTLGPTGRMQRIREQHQPAREIGRVGEQHARLPPAI
jgi:hypothetical protein